MSKPHINVTPLIDVLLVLLIIFMVVTPMKPSVFKARIPAEPEPHLPVEPNPQTLIVAVESNSDLLLNNDDVESTVEDPSALMQRLSAVFAERAKKATDVTSHPQAGVERTVFIKAPRSMPYGNIAKVVDAVKMAGARPISLQIDDLE